MIVFNTMFREFLCVFATRQWLGSHIHASHGDSKKLTAGVISCVSPAFSRALKKLASATAVVRNEEEGGGLSAETPSPETISKLPESLASKLAVTSSSPSTTDAKYGSNACSTGQAKQTMVSLVDVVTCYCRFVASSDRSVMSDYVLVLSAE